LDSYSSECHIPHSKPISPFITLIDLINNFVIQLVLMFNLKIARPVLGKEALGFLTGCATQIDIKSFVYHQIKSNHLFIIKSYQIICLSSNQIK